MILILYRLRILSQEWNRCWATIYLNYVDRLHAGPLFACPAVIVIIRKALVDWLIGVTCKVGGVKLVNSEDVDVDTYGGEVSFHAVKKSDEGRYACDAINDVGSAAGLIQLRVLGKQ